MVKFTALVDITKIYNAVDISLSTLSLHCSWINTQVNMLANGGGTPLRLTIIHQVLRSESPSCNAVAAVLCMEINDLLRTAHPGDWLSCEIKFINNKDKPHVKITLGFDTIC